MFRVILGCLHSNGHIDPSAGIFGVLTERYRKLIRHNPIPARSNTECIHRRTAQCNQDCSRSVYGIMVTGKISWRKIGATI